MNPFTRFLRSQRRTTPADLEEFILRWDALESLVINIYRADAVDEAAELAYSELRAWLHDHYPHWAASLAPFWREAKEAGVIPPPADPFTRLIAPASAVAFIGNRSLIQALPAARETLNRYLLSL